MSIARHDALVVGAGLSGLAAAIHLARDGRTVTVLESAPHVGGRARSRGPDGFAMNLGPHALYASAEARLRGLGVRVTGTRPGVGLTMSDGDRRYAIPVTPLSLLASGYLSVGEKMKLAGLLGRLGSMDAEAVDGTTVRAWLDDLGVGGRARRFLEAAIRLSTYAHAPGRMSAGLALRQLVLSSDGVRYIDDGWQSIVDAMVAVARQAGVRIETGVPVAQVEHDGAVRGVRLDDGSVREASTVVLTVAQKRVRRMVERLPVDLLEAIDDSVPVRAAALDVALSALPRRSPRLILGLDRPTYYSVHSLGSRLAPEGGAVIHLATYLAPGETVDPKAARAELEALLDEAQPGWRDVTVEASFLPAITVANWLPEARHGGQAGRPTVDATGIDGLLLAGDWIGPDGMLADAPLASAEQAAAVARRERPAVAA